jgi:6-phospho-3-hexuloisomerase
MLSDIDEKNVTKTVVDEIARTLGKITPETLTSAAELITKATTVFVAGAGRSALGIRGFAMRLMHMGKNAHVVGDVTTPGISAGDLLVVGSGSGRTASLLAMAQKAKKIGAKIMLVTIDPESPIGRLGHSVIEIGAPSPKAADAQSHAQSIQPMGSLFEQSLFVLLDCLVLLLMKRQNLTSEQMFTRHANLE